MALRGTLEGIKSGKIAQEETAKAEVVLSEQEKARQEEENFLDAHTRKHSLDEATRSLQGARDDTREVLSKRKAEFKNIKGLIEQIQAEDPTQQLPSFKEIVANPEEGSDEERYAQSKENVTASIAELRNQKEALKKLGVDTDGLNDDELKQAVEKAQEDNSVTIREFLIQHPGSELPEAVQERKERVDAVEQKIKSLERSMEEHTAWGTKHLGQGISTWNNDPEGLPNKIREGMTWDQESLDKDKVRLAQTSLYKDMLEGIGVMEDPEVKKTYEPAVKANEELRTLENALRAINDKPTKFFGYTESKKAEEVAAKKLEIVAKKEEATEKDAAYSEAARKFGERYDKAREFFQIGSGKKGGYEETKRELTTSIQDRTRRIEESREQLSNATHYAEKRRALMTDLESQSEELALLKGEKRSVG
ncbi:MAG: hypothetical protein JWN49_598 [Parcubacteria group bacterium]|nr:hypothetical protein [Parcubacteria group bacterium]